jgi:GT2 family glycosyltransferase
VSINNYNPRPMSPRPAVSVIVPTYHRPQSLRAAVESVLAQELVTGDLEVVVALSDPEAAPDREAAEELRVRDLRVLVATAKRLGPAAARNAGLNLTSAPAIALLDDDCVAEPGWLQAGLDALADADLVQGRTQPVEELDGYYRSIWVDRLSWLFESCNLFVRRDAVERGGRFDEDFNPTGVAGRHWGEDIEWAWRLIHSGASPAYCDAARVRHAVEPWTWWAWLRRRTEIRWFPLALQFAPELRERRFDGWFFTPHHRTVAATWAAAGVAAGLAGARRWRAARLCMVLAVGAHLVPLRHARDVREMAWWFRMTPRTLLVDGVELGSLLYGSVRYRRVLV